MKWALQLGVGKLSWHPGAGAGNHGGGAKGGGPGRTSQASRSVRPQMQLSAGVPDPAAGARLSWPPLASSTPLPRRGL